MKIKTKNQGLTKEFSLSKGETEELLKKAIAKLYKEEFDSGSYGAKVEWKDDCWVERVNIIFYRK